MVLKKILHKLNIERQLVLVLAGLCGITILLSSFQNYYFLSNLQEPLVRSMASIIIENALLNAVVMSTFVIFILYTTNYFFEKRTNIYYVIGFQLFIALISGFVGYVMIIFSSLIFGSMTFEQVSNMDHMRRALSDIDVHFLFYFSVLSIVYIYHYYKQFRESEFQRYETENKLTASNLNLIQSQLEPHFLFNTLNSISALIYADQDRAIKTISNLGDVLRDTLLLRDTQFVSVEQELGYLQKYIHILNVRFDGQIKYEVVVSDEVQDLKVPSLILQPIIENAVKHGLKNGKSSIQIQVEIRQEEEGELRISIKNSGSFLPEKPQQEESSNKVGIALVKERLALIYDQNSSFQIRNIRHPMYNVEVQIVISKPVQMISGTKD